MRLLDLRSAINRLPLSAILGNETITPADRGASATGESPGPGAIAGT